MDDNLRLLFDRALTDEPPLASDELSGRAMAAGAGLRRRRRQRALAGAVAGVAVVGVLGWVNAAGPPNGTPPPETVPAAFAGLVNPLCKSPARDLPTDLSVFLTMDITDDQRNLISVVLKGDPAVRYLEYESKDAAYASFAAVFAHKPELVAAVQPAQFPESFRAKLDAQATEPALVDRLRHTPGVEAVIRSACPAGARASVVD
jgi:hypothetical protein